MPPEKNLNRGSLSNWCDADVDTDSSKTICGPPPYGGVAIFMGLTAPVSALKSVTYDKTGHIGKVKTTDVLKYSRLIKMTQKINGLCSSQYRKL